MNCGMTKEEIKESENEIEKAVKELLEELKNPPMKVLSVSFAKCEDDKEDKENEENGYKTA